MKKKYEAQDAYHARIKASGLVRRSYYATPENHNKIKKYAKELQEGIDNRNPIK